jgi:hypothetical protein
LVPNENDKKEESANKQRNSTLNRT